MKLKTAELTGAALDWAVAQAEGRTDVTTMDFDELGVGCVQAEPDRFMNNSRCWAPTRYWQQASPIIERESIYLMPNENADGWFAHKVGGEQGDYGGPTPLVAAMRCFVASKLGDEVEIPDELVTTR